ncbi:MAG TPA: phosphoglucosamine mutase [Acidimicrobiales bacterium]|nr:phosphoglucosamine mutase [Acidimicrobiales bacterium]
MTPVRFGTDGVRGVAGADLTAELALAFGRSVARVLPSDFYLAGRDTRRSGPMLQAAVSAGLAAEGADVADVGVVPTPALAYLADQSGAPAVMVSASHNPFADNGLKVFGDRGQKLAEEVERRIEAELEALLGQPGQPARTGAGVGRLFGLTSPVDDYRRHLVASLDGRQLDGLEVVFDGANGAASELGPAVLAEAGADVTSLNCSPDGTNINDGCGSTKPEALASAVVAAGADLGLAVDGDADRLVAVDHTGAVADGDVLLALFAIDLAKRDELTNETVVVTVMTNLGFRLAMAERGIAVVETPVGDRHVLAALDQEGLALGGEQSGHIVFRRRATTGDGLLTGLLLADLVARHGRPLADLTAGLVERVPQVLVNVAVADPGRLAGASVVWEAVGRVEAELGGRGRVVLRPSGTEPLVRVMVEAATEDEASAAAGRLCTVVEQVLGPASP